MAATYAIGTIPMIKISFQPLKMLCARAGVDIAETVATQLVSGNLIFTTKTKQGITTEGRTHSVCILYDTHRGWTPEEGTPGRG